MSIFFPWLNLFNGSDENNAFCLQCGLWTLHSYHQRRMKDCMLYVYSFRRCHFSTYLVVLNRIECKLQKAKDDNDNAKHPNKVVKCMRLKWESKWRLKTIQIPKEVKVKRTTTNQKNQFLKKETLGQKTFNSSAYFVLFVC